MNEELTHIKPERPPNRLRRRGQLAIIVPALIFIVLLIPDRLCNQAVGYRQPTFLIFLIGLGVFGILTLIYFWARVREKYWINFLAFSFIGLPLGLFLALEIFNIINFYCDRSPVVSHVVEVLGTFSDSRHIGYKVDDWSGSIKNFTIGYTRNELFSRLIFPAGIVKGDKLLIQTRAGWLGQEYYISITKVNP
jgi:hypothetical protein